MGVLDVLAIITKYLTSVVLVNLPSLKVVWKLMYSLIKTFSPWTTLIHQHLLDHKVLNFHYNHHGIVWFVPTPWKSMLENVMGGILLHKKFWDTAFVDWIVLKCLILTKDIALPPLKAPNIMLIVHLEGGLSPKLLSFCLTESSFCSCLYLFSLLFGHLYGHHNSCTWSENSLHNLAIQIISGARHESPISPCGKEQCTHQ